MESQSLEFKGLKRRPNQNYVYSSAAPAARPNRRANKGLEVLPKEIKKFNISSKLLLTFFYILCTGLFIGAILMYISLQGELSTSVDEIASLQSQYETIKKNNDAEYARINNNVDFENIRKVAIEELGMHYASDGQIVVYTTEDSNDYVKVNQYVRQ